MASRGCSPFLNFISTSQSTTQKTNHRGSPVMACKVVACKVVDKRATLQCDLFETVLPETLASFLLCLQNELTESLYLQAAKYAAVEINNAPCCFAYPSNHNVMITNVQTPLHCEYILYLNVHCNGSVVNSWLHMTLLIPGCGTVC